MLGKLIKHEWKAVWKFLTIINVFMIGVTLIGGLGMIFLDGGGSSHSNAREDIIVNMLVSVYLFTYFLSLFAVTVSTLIYLGVRFYKSMYGDEGYLTNTLPATPMQLICSKSIVAILWYWISILVMAASVLTLLMFVTFASGDPFIWSELWEGLRTIGREMSANGLSPIGTLFLYGILCILGTVSGIFMMYGSIAIGQLFDKHRILSAVGFYFGINMAFQIISSLVTGIVMYATRDFVGSNGAGMVYFIGWVTLGFSVLIGTVCFLITYLLTTRKLNLE